MPNHHDTILRLQRLPRFQLSREHAQRFCGEASVKLAKVDKVFLTGTGAEEHAGLSGLILTLSALGSRALEVFGPTGVDKLVVRDPVELRTVKRQCLRLPETVRR